MSESARNTSLKPTSGDSSESLTKPTVEEIPTYVEFYSDRLCAHAWQRTKGNANVELITATIFSIFVAGVTSGFSLEGVSYGVATFFGTLIVAFHIHLLLSPRDLDKQQRGEIAKLQKDLSAQMITVGQYATMLTEVNYEKTKLSERVEVLSREIEQTTLRCTTLEEQVAKLKQRLEPNLKITYEPNQAPFMQVYSNEVTQYRVCVMSPTPISDAELVANKLIIEGIDYSGIHLRPRHERDSERGTKRVALKAFKEDAWDVFSKHPSIPMA